MNKILRMYGIFYFIDFVGYYGVKERVPREYMEKGSYLLLKAAIFWFCKNNPYSPSSELTKKEFKDLGL